MRSDIISAVVARPFLFRRCRIAQNEREGEEEYTCTDRCAGVRELRLPRCYTRPLVRNTLSARIVSARSGARDSIESDWFGIRVAVPMRRAFSVAPRSR